MNRAGSTIAIIAVTLGIMADRTLASTPHPLIRGLAAIEIACAVDPDTIEPTDGFGSAYCAELSRLVHQQLPVPVNIVSDVGPLAGGAEPRPGTVWIKSSLRFDGSMITARTSWGSHRNQRGVSPSEDGPPVSLQTGEGPDTEADARLLARRVVDTLVFVPKT